MVANKSSAKPPRATPSKGRKERLIGRRSLRTLLRRDGRRDEITAGAFDLLSTVGTQLIKKIINMCKQEMMHTLGAKGGNVTITTGTIAHAANCLKINGDVTDEAFSVLTSVNYDTKAFRRSATRRLVQQHGGKKRARSNVPAFLYCITMIIMDELVTQIQQSKGEKNIRIKNEHIFQAIHSASSNLLAPMKTVVGNGLSFV